jgi:hypothetical protein
MRKLSAALLIVFLSSSAPVFSKSHSDKSADKKNADKQSTDKKSEDKKHLLIDEIVEALKAESKLSDEELSELKKKQEERMDRIVDTIAEKAQLSNEEKAKLKEKIAERKKREKHPMPPELKEKLEKRFDFENFKKQTTYQVMSDHFDNKDLKVILKFVKSPTGQKILHEGPDMLGQVVELSAEKYVPIMMDICKELKLKPGRLLAPRQKTPEQKRQMLEKIREFFKDKLPPQPPETPPAPPGPGKNET